MSTQEQSATAREMTPWELRLDRLKLWLERLRRKLPHLVWHGDEVYVRVHIAIDDEAQLKKLWATEQALRDLGIGFDTGTAMGSCMRRDWEWDWSLRGPISLRYIYSSKKRPSPGATP